MLLLLLIYSYAADTHISMTSLCVHTFSVLGAGKTPVFFFTLNDTKFAGFVQPIQVDCHVTGRYIACSRRVIIMFMRLMQSVITDVEHGTLHSHLIN